MEGKEFSRKADEKTGAQEYKRIERLRRKSLLSSSGGNRAPTPHSIMVQRQVIEDTDFGMNLRAIENELMTLKLEDPQPLSVSELAEYEEGVQKYVDSENCNEQMIE